MAPVEGANEPRDFMGYSIFAQYAPGSFDINAGFGVSTAAQSDLDKIDPNTMMPPPQSLIKSHTGFFGAFVYHIDENLHASIDLMQAAFKWHRGEEQAVTFINLGATIDW
jgi:hypothetical protein